MKEGNYPTHAKGALEQRLIAKLEQLHAIENKSPEQWQTTLETARALDTVRGPAWRLLSALAHAYPEADEEKPQTP